jgi:predicted GNAT family N-acyltransferase
MGSSFVVRCADWDRDREDLRRVREAVFVREQKVPLELEWDGLDEACVHVLALDRGGLPIGTGRLLPDGHIGRMAVLPSWRRHGVGAALLNELVRLATERGLVQVMLNAQVQAIGFYARYGFAADGEEFLDAGISHRRMCRVLGKL